jgi:hypothetical protein
VSVNLDVAVAVHVNDHVNVNVDDYLDGAVCSV